MNTRCFKCNRELVCDSADADDSRTVLHSPPICPDCGAATMDSDKSDGATVAHAIPLAKIAHFRLERLLGSGGFGDVWLATDTRLRRTVALKLSKTRRMEYSTLVFEAQTAASLRHPNIVPVHEVGEHGGQVYIVSDLIDGMTLADLLSAGKPPWNRTIALLISIARAIHFAHTRGIYHRDVKPANILVDHAGQPYVTDFGLAKRASDTSSSGAGRMVGTVRYMSPEQAVGNLGQTDGRSDIYALGVTMFEMFTGETPFRGNAQAILHQKVFDDPTSPRVLEPSLPKDLETICLKCLEREPGKRFQTAQELAEELVRYAAHEPIHSRPISRAERTWRWCQKRPAIAGLLGGLILSLTCGLIGVTYFWRLAVTQEAVANHSLYRSWMNMAAMHLKSGDTTGVRNVLVRVADDTTLRDYRSFEWKYFDKQIAPITSVANLGTAVVDVAITHDGDYCAAAGAGSEVRVWDVKTQELVRTLTVDQSGFQTVDFSPTSAHLAIGSLDGYVRTFDPLTSARMLRPIKHGPPVAFVCYSPNGQQLVSAGKSGAVRVWNPTDGSVLAELPTGKRGGETEVVRYSPDGRELYVVSSDGHARVWDMNLSGTVAPGVVPAPLWELETGSNSLTAMTISDDQKVLVCGNYYGAATTFSIADRTTELFQSHWGRIAALESIPNTPLFAAATNDGLLHMYSREIQNDTRDIRAHGIGDAKLSRSHNGKALAIGTSDGSVSVIELAKLIRPTIFWHPDQQPARSLEFLGNASKLLVSYANGDLWLWNTEEATYRRLIEEPKKSDRIVAVHPNRQMFATASASAIEVWDANTMKVIHELSGATAGVTSMRFSRTGELFAVALRNGPIRVYQTSLWSKPLWDIEGNDIGATSVDFSPDDSLVARTDGRNCVELLDARNGESRDVITLELEPSVVNFCNQGDELAIGTNTGDILLWGLKSNRLRLSVKGHTGRIHALTQMPAGTILISAGRDKILKLWDLPSGELIAPLAGHFRQVFAVSVSPEGKTIASASLEGDVRLWRSE